MLIQQFGELETSLLNLCLYLVAAADISGPCESTDANRYVLCI